MNVTAYSCGDTSLGFSCGDCPSASVCSSSAPTQPHKKGSCSVRIGSLKVCKFKFRMLKQMIHVFSGSVMDVTCRRDVLKFH